MLDFSLRNSTLCFHTFQQSKKHASVKWPLNTWMSFCPEAQTSYEIPIVTSQNKPFLKVLEDTLRKAEQKNQSKAFLMYHC